VTAPNFRVEGVICPPRVCALVAPALLRDLRAAHARYGQADPEAEAWIFAVNREANRYNAGANANGIKPSASAACESANDGNGDASQWLNAEQAASVIECSASNVRYLARKGRLPAAHTKPYLFDSFEVERYKHSRKEF
jgi:hypothetical protein